MLNLILLIIAVIYNLAIVSFQIHFHTNKCLGLQTLYDLALVHCFQCNILNMIFTVFQSTIATFTDSTWSPFMASLITLPTYVIPTNATLSLASLAALRYLMVFHGTIFHRMEDEKVISIVRLSQFLLATMMVSYEYATSESLGHLYYFGVMTNTYSNSGGYLISIRIATYLALISFLILWIRLEILNYKYGEGFVKVWKKWWKNKQQGETYENEEFGINFQRINMILACFMSLTFFFYVSGHFLNYPLFGIEGKVFSVVLLQIPFKIQLPESI